MKSILIFDPEILGYDQLSKWLQAITNDENLNMVSVETLDEFKETLSKTHFSVVMINFQIEYFFDMRSDDIKGFIASLRALHEISILFIGITGNPHQKNLLEKCGVKILYKIHDGEQIKRLFLSTFSENQKRVTLQAIQEIVCNEYLVEYDSLFIKCRRREYVMPRYVTIYFSSLYTKEKAMVISSHFNYKENYRIILYSCKKVKDLMDTNEDFNKLVRKIDMELKRTFNIQGII
jgi:hypothetical protein